MIDKFAIIIGSMKSGSTSLFEYLAQHPQIAPARDKEPEFFVRAEKLANGIESYEKLWDWDESVHQYALEASTSYTKLPVFPNAAQKMQEFDREFKFIYIIRDPINRIISQLGHTAMVYQVGTQELNDTILQRAIHYSSYAMQINEYAERFGKENILLVQFEAFIRDPLATCAEVSQFLGLADDFQFQMIDAKNKKYDLMLSSKLKFIYPLRNLVPKVIKRKIIDSIVGNRLFRDYVNNNLAQTVSLDDNSKSSIKKALLADIQELEQNYPIDTSQWREWHSIKI